MRARLVEALKDANEIMSDLAYWVSASDADAAIRIAQGFGAALERSASMRASGYAADAIALALAEQATELGETKDLQHVGWLLLSLKLEILKVADEPSDGRTETEDLLRELDELAAQLVRKGTAAFLGRPAD